MLNISGLNVRTMMSSVCRNLFSLLGERNREWSERGGCWGTTEKGNEDGNQSTAIAQFWIVSSQAPWRFCPGVSEWGFHLTWNPEVMHIMSMPHTAGKG